MEQTSSLFKVYTITTHSIYLGMEWVTFIEICIQTISNILGTNHIANMIVVGSWDHPLGFRSGILKMFHRTYDNV